MTPQGEVTTLYDFTGHDGASPRAPLFQSTDGNFYGTTYSSISTKGTDSFGTVFKITSQGKLTGLHTFSLAGLDGQTHLQA